MKEDTLLLRAEKDIWVAETIFNVLTGDECEVNFIAYHLQQALEKCLKFQLEIKGVPYPFTHEISKLWKADGEVKESLTGELREESETISNWESQGRYIKGYLVSMKDAKNMLKLIKEHVVKVREAEDKRTAEAKLILQEDAGSTDEFNED